MNNPAKVVHSPSVAVDDPTLPHSVEAEQAVLGALLLRNDAFDGVAANLQPTDFFRTDHRLIFAAMMRLADEKSPFDAITLSESLRHHGELETAGGVSYLIELADSTPSSANVNAYAQIVLERSLIRQLIAASTDITQKGYNPLGWDSATLLADAEQKLQRIMEGRPKVGGFQFVDELIKQAINRLHELSKSKSTITGLSTGYIDLDDMTSGWQKSDLVIVAGRPSMGKTSFAMNMVEHAVLHQPRPVLVFSLEMPAGALITRMLSSIGKIDQTHMRSGNFQSGELDRLLTASSQLKGRPLYIDDTPGITPMDMRNRIKQFTKQQVEKLVRQFKAENGDQAEPDMAEIEKRALPALIMIDYLQLMTVDSARSEGRQQEISQISRELKQIAREYESPVIALSQLSRNVEQRPNKRPVNSDLRESGAIEQDADVILFIYRDVVYNENTEEKNIAEIIIGKQRNGPIGTCKLRFDGQYTRFENLAPDRGDDYY